MKSKLVVLTLILYLALASGLPQLKKKASSTVIECKVNEELDSKCEDPEDAQCRICVHQTFSNNCKPANCPELLDCIESLDLDCDTSKNRK